MITVNLPKPEGKTYTIYVDRNVPIKVVSLDGDTITLTPFPTWFQRLWKWVRRER